MSAFLTADFLPGSDVARELYQDNLGLLSRFVGLPANSHSFLSCSCRGCPCWIGRDAGGAELPRDMRLLGDLVAETSFDNARAFFGLDVSAAS